MTFSRSSLPVCSHVPQILFSNSVKHLMLYCKGNFIDFNVCKSKERLTVYNLNNILLLTTTPHHNTHNQRSESNRDWTKPTCFSNTTVSIMDLLSTSHRKYTVPKSTIPPQFLVNINIKSDTQHILASRWRENNWPHLILSNREERLLVTLNMPWLSLTGKSLVWYLRL